MTFQLSSTFQYSAYILPLDWQDYNCFSWYLVCLVVPKKAEWPQRSMLTFI